MEMILYAVLITWAGRLMLAWFGKSADTGITQHH